MVPASQWPGQATRAQPRRCPSRCRTACACTGAEADPPPMRARSFALLLRFGGLVAQRLFGFDKGGLRNTSSWLTGTRDVTAWPEVLEQAPQRLHQQLPLPQEGWQGV